MAKRSTKKRSCSPKKRSCSPKKRSCSPKKRSCSPKKRSCSPKKRSCSKPRRKYLQITNDEGQKQSIRIGSDRAAELGISNCTKPGWFPSPDTGACMKLKDNPFDYKLVRKNGKDYFKPRRGSPALSLEFTRDRVDEMMDAEDCQSNTIFAALDITSNPFAAASAPACNFQTGCSGNVVENTPNDDYYYKQDYAETNPALIYSTGSPIRYGRKTYNPTPGFYQHCSTDAYKAGLSCCSSTDKLPNTDTGACTSISNLRLNRSKLGMADLYTPQSGYDKDIGNKTIAAINTARGKYNYAAFAP